MDINKISMGGILRITGNTITTAIMLPAAYLAENHYVGRVAPKFINEQYEGRLNQLKGWASDLDETKAKENGERIEALAELGYKHASDVKAKTFGKPSALTVAVEKSAIDLRATELGYHVRTGKSRDCEELAVQENEIREIIPPDVAPEMREIYTNAYLAGFEKAKQLKNVVCNGKDLRQRVIQEASHIF